MSVVSIAAPKRLVELTVDGESVRVTEGSTILDACRRLGIETPTLCYGDTLRPVNVCRVCAVVLAQGRAGHGRAHELAARRDEPASRPRAARLLRRPLHRP